MSTLDPPPTIERDGRRFLASSASVPMVYAFPVDEQAQQSYDNLHDTLRTIIQGNYHGPVEEILAEGPGRVKSVLDLGCSSGKWVKELAEQFPHVQFTGVDIMPPFDQTAPSNVQFELGDLTKRTRFEDNTFDMVHLRFMILTVTDYVALLIEAARILRPGGLLLSVEFSWHFQSDLPNNVPMEVHLPAFSRMARTLAHCLHPAGSRTRAEQVPMQIRSLEPLKDDISVVHTMPVGPHQFDEDQEELGDKLSRHFIGTTRAVRWLFKKDAGWSDEEFHEVMAATEEELNTKPGLIFSVYVTHARKA